MPLKTTGPDWPRLAPREGTVRGKTTGPLAPPPYRGGAVVPVPRAPSEAAPQRAPHGGSR